MVLVANDYYDFNPSPTTWAILLSGMVVFVLVLSVALIYLVDRGQASGPAPAAQAVPPAGELPVTKPPKVKRIGSPTAHAS